MIQLSRPVPSVSVPRHSPAALSSDFADGPAGPADPEDPAPPSTAESSRQRRIEVLGEKIAHLSAHIQAATGRLLELIRDFDASEGWHEEGFKSCALWLSWRTGIAPGAAREKVRVARALEELPELSGALGSGELSYSVARALTRVATAENEADLVEVARHATAADLERLVRGWQVADRSEADERERHALRYLRLMPDADGSWTVRGRLDPEVGALLCRALEAASETFRRAELADADSSAVGQPAAQYRARCPSEYPPQYPVETRRADAIGLVAEAALGCDLGAGAEDAPAVSRAERFQVVMHVSAETLGCSGCDDEDEDLARVDQELHVSAETPEPDDADNAQNARSARNATDNIARIDHGPYIPAETARRLACDAGLVTMTHDREGNVLDVGRRRRTVPAAIRRALEDRDRGCRFPGCTSRFCDAHHVKPWAQGGETTLDNLLLLCRHHHRRVHEDGWRVTLSEAGEAGFHRPDGRFLPRVPAPCAVPVDPAVHLERDNDRIGIEIDAWTATPRWTGERMDVDWALLTLWRPALPHVSTEEGVSAETSGSSVARPQC